MTLVHINIIAAAKDGGGFDWSGIWTVLAALVAGVASLISLNKSKRSERDATTLAQQRFESDEHERALENAIEECDRCREMLAAERESAESERAAAVAKLREAEQKLNEALVSANEAWVLVGTYRERERVWLIERAELLRRIERGQT